MGIFYLFPTDEILEQLPLAVPARRAINKCGIRQWLIPAVGGGVVVAVKNWLGRKGQVIGLDSHDPTLLRGNIFSQLLFRSYTFFNLSKI